MEATVPNQEAARLEALRQYEILDTAPEAAFDELVDLAAHICGTAIALINFVDHDRQWFKAKVGLTVSEVPRDVGLSYLCLERREVVVIPDAQADPRSATNPLVTGYPYIRFYAGVPLIAPAGHTIGTLCALDPLPRHLSRQQIEALQTLGRQVISQLELRRTVRVLAQTAHQFQQAEESLRQAAAENFRLAQAIASVSDGVLITDARQPDNPLIYANPAFSAVSGYSLEEAQGRNCRFLQGPGTDPETAAQLHAAIAAKQPIKTTLLNYRKNGQPFWNEVKIAPVLSDVGELLYFVGIQTDVTERKQAEEKIREQAALLNVATDAIFVQSLQQTIVFWNLGAERLYGWRADEMMGENAIARLHPGRETDMDAIVQTVITAGNWQGELHQVAHDGRSITVESRWTLMRDEAGDPKSILVVNTDRTEQKQLETQFLRAQRMESLGTLASGIAHDLNNILTPILSSAQLLLMQNSLPENKQQQLLKTVESSARRGADLVKQVLSFARGVEGKRTVLHLRHLISEIYQIVLETFPKSIVVQAEVDTELWMVTGDSTQLHQVLMNLCLNARDAMPKGGMLSLTATNLLIDEQFARMHLDASVGLHVVLTVSDTGVGIPPDALDRIFEPFFTTKEVGQGTGLGLSTGLSIVKSHGGFIDVTSNPGQGSRFQVYLPAIPTAVPQSTESRDCCVGNGELILVVDDEALVRETAQASLEAHNYRVMTACDGIEAIALYAQHHGAIALALVDIMMPTMDGPMTIRTLRKMNPQLKIIAVSGLISSTQLSESVNSGIHTFLSKPYTTPELLNLIHQALSQPNSTLF